MVRRSKEEQLQFICKSRNKGKKGKGQKGKKCKYSFKLQVASKKTTSSHSSLRALCIFKARGNP